MRVVAASSVCLVFLAAGPLLAQMKDKQSKPTSSQKPGKEAKRANWPPKFGVKSPGIQIPYTDLKAEAELPLSGEPGGLTFGAQLLVPNTSGDELFRFDTRENKALDSFKGFNKPCGQAINAFQNLWVPSCGGQAVIRAEARTGKVTKTLPFGTGSAKTPIAATPDSVWMLTDDKTTLTRIDPQENAIVAQLRLPAACTQMAFAEGTLWVICPSETRLLRIDPNTNLVKERIEVGKKPVSIAFGEGSAWVLLQTEGKVVRLDPKTNKIVATIDLGIPEAAGNLVFGEGNVWVTAPGFPLTRINPASDKVIQQFAGDAPASTLYFGANALWLASKDKLVRIDPRRAMATLAN